MLQEMLSQICSRGSVVRALRFVSERLRVLIQTARFCPSGVSALNLFISSEAKACLSSRHVGLPPRGKNLLLLKLVFKLLHSKVERSSRRLHERSLANLPPFQWTAESTDSESEQGFLKCIWILATYDIVGHLRYRRSVTTIS